MKTAAAAAAAASIGRPCQHLYINGMQVKQSQTRAEKYVLWRNRTHLTDQWLAQTPRTLTLTLTLTQWRTQNIRMGGVEVPHVPRGLGVGMGHPPLHWGKGLGRGLQPPPPKKKSFFLLKIPHFDTFWHVYFLNHTPMGGVLSNP